MTTSDDDAYGEAEKDDDRRRPPSGRFQKGKSGNPRGRPPKQAAQPEVAPARFPTRDLLRAGGARSIVVADASGKQTVSTREAVLRALAIAAMRGRVLAARTFLTLHLAEDG